MPRNTVKEILASGNVAAGTMVAEFGTTGIARIVASVGADFILLDTEHTGWTTETLRTLLATVRRPELVPIVRVPTLEYSAVARTLDLGAMGIMVPYIESAAQARRLVEFARYPPNGRRGVTFGLASDDYMDVGNLDEALRKRDEETLLIALVESAEGIRNIDAIAQVDGIDVVWIGQFDLTVSVGRPGDFEDPSYLASVGGLLDACRRHGKAAGYTATSHEDVREAVRAGFRCIAYSFDVRIYRQSLSDGIAQIRQAAAALTG
ncbi:MAG: HpcH/HpaI aldolase family protein [Aeromicrobium sp.]